MARNIIKILPLLIGLLSAAATFAQHAAHSVLHEGSWFKIGIPTTGVYKLTTADLAALEGKPFNSIALYGQAGGTLPEKNSQSRPDDLAPIHIAIYDANNNGLFNAADYIVFYAEAASVWRYNSDDLRYEFLMNPYDTKNYYFLRTDAPNNHLVATAEVLQPGQNAISTYTARYTIHTDLYNTHGSGKIWVGDKFGTATASRSYSLEMPNAVMGSTAKLRYAFASIASSNSRFSVTCGSLARDYTFLPLRNYQTFMEECSSLHSATLNIGVNYVEASGRGAGYLDFIEVNVPTTLRMGNKPLDFRTDPTATSSNATILVAGATTSTTVWEVTNPTTPVAMSTTPSSQGLTFVANTEQRKEYIAFNSSHLYTPSDISPLQCQDLHGSTAPDMVIVCHPNFLAQGERLANLHRLHDQMEVLVVTPEVVYNEFSSGRQDPMAIREMMRMFWHRDTATPHCRYLLLFGKGTYDNRNILGKNSNTIITYQSERSFELDGGSYASDDHFGYLHPSESGNSAESLDISIGRLPAATVEQATHLVDKIERYITKADLTNPEVRGDWRNYVALLADDADPSCGSDTVFTYSSELTARRIKSTYPQYNIDRIYSDAFVQQSGADGSFYPDANNALKKRLDYGCLLLNYIGHGSAQYIGTERYMQISDMDSYANSDRLAFFVTSTCSFGKYDRPDTISGAESFLLAPNAGVGVVAASRPIGHVQRFNTDVCLYALDPTNRIGDALRLAKNRTPSSHSITLFGDPALRLTFPKYEVVVTTINGKTVDSLADTATTLSRITIEGEIRDAHGVLQEDFNGEIYPIVFDREVSARTLANDNEGYEVNFVHQKNILYKGREKVINGKFSYTFIVPRDVPYTYNYGKLSHYAKSGSDDATGSYSNILFGGFDPTIEIAEIRPTVHLYLNDTLFHSGGITNQNPTLFAVLEDSVGINTAGSGIGHDITAVLDNNYNNIMVLNDFYETDMQNAHRGYVNYNLYGLDEGWHTLTLKAWNIYNYSAVDSLRFYVRTTDKPEIGAFYAQPNPAANFTTIRLEHNTTPKDATIEIYDLYGQRVRTLKPTLAESSNVIELTHIPLTNNAGTPLPQGCYVARAYLYTTANELLTATTKIVKVQ